MPRFILSLFFALMSASSIYAQTVFGFQETLPFTESVHELSGTTKISPVGVGSDGLTTYIQEVNFTALFASESGKVSTISTFESAVAETITFIEDASRIILIPTGTPAATAEAAGETCTYGADGSGGCVLVFPSDEGGSTTSFSGVAVALTTIGVPAATPTNAGARSFIPLTGSTVGGVAVALVAVFLC